MQLILVLILPSIFVFVIAGWEDQVKQLYALQLILVLYSYQTALCPWVKLNPQVVVSIFIFHAVSWFNRYDSANNIMIAVVLK